MEFINLKAQYNAYKDEIDKSINAVIESSKFILGDSIDVLESNLSSYLGVKHSIACSSGTDALILALMALDIKSGDEVITSPFSFIASIEAIMLLGAKPVFVDIDSKTYNIDCNLLKNAITKKTKAIIPVSIFGQMCDMDAINDIAGDIPVIEDAAQSFGASFLGKNGVVKSCNSSLIATTSFFPSKPLGCYGDGGAVFSKDDYLADKIRYLLNHGQVERYKHKYVGLNARLDTIQAAVLNVKLKYIDKEIQKRQEIAKIYNENLNGVITPFIAPNHTSAYAQYSICSDNRDALVKQLLDNNVPYAIHYPIPLHLQEVVTRLYKPSVYPIAESLCKKILSIPFSPFLTTDEQNIVIKAVNDS